MRSAAAKVAASRRPVLFLKTCFIKVHVLLHAVGRGHGPAADAAGVCQKILIFARAARDRRPAGADGRRTRSRPLSGAET